MEEIRINVKRYNMCKDQNAQINCMNDECMFQYKGDCNNISPAITLNENKTFVCHSILSKTLTITFNGN